MLKVFENVKDESGDFSPNLKVECISTLINAQYLCEFLILSKDVL